MGDPRAEIERQLGRGVKLGQFPWLLLSLTAPVWELAREMREMRYLYETPHALDGALMALLLPGFQGIGLTEVVARHLRTRGL